MIQPATYGRPSQIAIRDEGFGVCVPTTRIIVVWESLGSTLGSPSLWRQQEHFVNGWLQKLRFTGCG